MNSALEQLHFFSSPMVVSFIIFITIAYLRFDRKDITS
jgi:ABC-type transport system involved in multi-copper enzyme maturation permease subunit